MYYLQRSSCVYIKETALELSLFTIRPERPHSYSLSIRYRYIEFSFSGIGQFGSGFHYFCTSLKNSSHKTSPVDTGHIAYRTVYKQPRADANAHFSVYEQYQYDSR